jgi:hypothetical protein
VILKPGDIVRGDIPDPEGNPCDEQHRAMVLRANDSSAWIVGISSKFDNDHRPWYWLLLPNSPGGHEVTRLTIPCVLKCNWYCQKPVQQLKQTNGVVPPEIFEKAVNAVLEVHKQKMAANQLNR